MVSVVEKILEKGVYDVNLMGQHTKDMCKVQHRVSLLHVAVMEGDKIGERNSSGASCRLLSSW